MNPVQLWGNLLSYSAQVLALVAAGAILQMLFRVRLPRAHLLFCQLMLVACFVLPAVQPWQSPMIVVPEGPPAAAVSVAAPQPVQQQPAQRPAIPWEQTALMALAAGAALRALWLLVGLARLRRYRTLATPLYPLPEAIEAARLRTGAEAVVCVSSDVECPVTFGYLYPVILLPPAIFDKPFETQFAIASHEFLHVRRHDWLLTVCEELAGAALWFHPAVWWLLAQIRLSREQVVDREVVALTSARDPYVTALLSMAGTRLRLDLAPAPLFLRKRHLAQRIRSLLKEVSMSKQRLVSSYVSIAAMLILAVGFTVVLFPLNGTAQVQVQQTNFNDGPGITVDPGGKLLHRPPIRYPAAALPGRIEGIVTVVLTLSTDGTVSDARIVSGPEDLRKTVLESALQWHYLNEARSPSTAQATVEFRVPEMPPVPTQTGVLGGIIGVAPGAPPPPPGAIQVPPSANRFYFAGSGPAPTAYQGTLPVLESIDVSRLPEPLQSMLRDKLASFQGQPASGDLMSRIRDLASAVDTHLTCQWRILPESRGVSLILTLSDGTAPSVIQTSPMPQATVPATPGGPMRVRVGSDVQASRLINAPAAEYPPLARSARISGVVRFNAVIGIDGRIQNLQLVTGHPLLVPPAQAAVSQYVYQPTLLNGQPVEVLTQVDVNFTYQ
jgi:beta-lactamase regulating signal transducer with metallopeptidase domain/outer membrane biosynthesis protein TonB